MKRLLFATLAASALACRGGEAPTFPEAFFFADHVDEAVADYDELQFRSQRKDGRLAARVEFPQDDDVNESRYSLTPPIPSRLTFDAEIGEGAVLEFEIGVDTLGTGALPAPVVFAIEIDGEVVFEEVVRRRFGDEWSRRRLELSPRGSARLTFATRFQKTPFSRPEDAALAAGVVPAWGHPVLARATDVPERPNLILISIDCLRADHVGAYGHDAPSTPVLDRFAEDAIVFENAASVSSWTLPTHMSMFTGLMPSEHGVRRARKRFPMTPYLPEILAGEGYETIGVVSGLYLTRTWGFDEGFHVYRERIDEHAEMLVAAAEDYFLAEPARPRFLFLHFFDAHWPYLPDLEDVERVGERPRDISDIQQTVLHGQAPGDAREIDEAKTLYDAEVATVDEQIGRFFDELKRRGLYDPALIVVTADHGEGFYEHEEWQHSGVIYNEVTRVPLIVKPPRSAGGARVDALVSQLGIFPTFLEAVGRESPFEHPSLVALARDGAPAPRRVMSEITWEPNDVRGPYLKLATTEGSLKYVATFRGELGDEQFVSELVAEELYDLGADPGETANLLPERARDAATLRADVRAYLDVVRRSRQTTEGERTELDESTIEKLRALGYVQ